MTSAPPQTPCETCLTGYFYLMRPGGEWRCHECEPPQARIQATLSVPGGKLKSGERRPLGAQLSAAVEGLPLTPRKLFTLLDQDDLEDIKHGRIPPETLRAYAEYFSRCERRR